MRSSLHTSSHFPFPFASSSCSLPPPISSARELEKYERKHQQKATMHLQLHIHVIPNKIENFREPGRFGTHPSLPDPLPNPFPDPPPNPLPDPLAGLLPLLSISPPISSCFACFLPRSQPCPTWRNPTIHFAESFQAWRSAH